MQFESPIQFEILVDSQENKRQCTIHPLRMRPDFKVSYFHPGNASIPALTAGVLLHMDGLPLDEFVQRGSSISSVATIDCTWKKLNRTLQRLEKPFPALVKVPSDFVTAYPRRSKFEGLDPTGGLATIEALFIAAAFFGHWDETLLDKFYFKNEFLRLNSPNWTKYQLGPK